MSNKDKHPFNELNYYIYIYDFVIIIEYLE